MLSGVLLIVVTMFAVLGAYYLSDVLAGCARRRSRLCGAVVLLAADGAAQVWNGVLDVRARMPDAPVVVLCREPVDAQRLEPSMKGVVFATPETLGETVCAQLGAAQNAPP